MKVILALHHRWSRHRHQKSIWSLLWRILSDFLDNFCRASPKTGCWFIVQWFSQILFQRKVKSRATVINAPETINTVQRFTEYWLLIGSQHVCWTDFCCFIFFSCYSVCQFYAETIMYTLNLSTTSIRFSGCNMQVIRNRRIR